MTDIQVHLSLDGDALAAGVLAALKADRGRPGVPSPTPAPSSQMCLALPDDFTKPGMIRIIRLDDNGDWTEILPDLECRATAFQGDARGGPFIHLNLRLKPRGNAGATGSPST